MGVLPRRLSSINFSPPSTARDGDSKKQRSGCVELLKFSATMDMDLDDVPTVTMTRKESHSPPPPTRTFEGQNVDMGV